MKKLINIFFIVISTAGYAQKDFCSICDRLGKSKESSEEYNLKCIQRDSSDIGESKYEIRKKNKCDDKVTLSQYNIKDSIPFFSIEINEGRDTVYLYLDKPSEFSGGRTALSKYMKDKIIYPKTALKRGIQGKVVISFFVSKTGEIYGAKVIKEVEASLNNEALRFVQEMPNWIPAQYGNKSVVSRIAFPVNFYLAP